MKYNKIGIIGAMKIETEGLIAEMKQVKEDVFSGMHFFSGELCGKNVVVVTSGVGKVFAAMAAQTLILKFGVDALINTGIAGGLAKELRPFDTVIADKLVQHDMNTSAVGDPLGMISGINRIELPVDAELSKVLKSAAESVGLHTVVGIVASGDLFTVKEKTKNNIRSRFGADACEMEGAAIGQVAFVNELPFAALRIISDGGDGIEYEKFAPMAADYSVKTTLSFLTNL